MVTPWAQEYFVHKERLREKISDTHLDMNTSEHLSEAEVVLDTSDTI